MKFPRLRTILLAPVLLFAVFYVVAAAKFTLDDQTVPALDGPASPHESVAIFGASGTAGDGILKAALADSSIKTVHVITRRTTPRIDQGVSRGKVKMQIHMDYLDYGAVVESLKDVDAVFWAIGTSTFGVDPETYGRIHVDFPMKFVEQWDPISSKPHRSFHYISSSDISDDSSMMWAREKVRAEKSLFGFAAGKDLTVVAYRPDYIGPTEDTAHLGQNLVYWFFAPVKAAVRAQQIGQAMIEVTSRGGEFKTGDKLSTGRILRYSDAYVLRAL